MRSGMQLSPNILILKFFAARLPLLTPKLWWPPLFSVHGQRAVSLQMERLSPPRTLPATLASSQPQTNECLVPEQSDSPIYLYMYTAYIYGITYVLGKKQLSEFPWISSSVLHDLKYCNIPSCLILEPTSTTHHDRIRQHHRQWRLLQRTNYF